MKSKLDIETIKKALNNVSSQSKEARNMGEALAAQMGKPREATMAMIVCSVPMLTLLCDLCKYGEETLEDFTNFVNLERMKESGELN